MHVALSCATIDAHESVLCALVGNGTELRVSYDGLKKTASWTPGSCPPSAKKLRLSKHATNQIISAIAECTPLSRQEPFAPSDLPALEDFIARDTQVIGMLLNKWIGDSTTRKELYGEALIETPTLLQKGRDQVGRLRQDVASAVLNTRTKSTTEPLLSISCVENNIDKWAERWDDVAYGGTSYLTHAQVECLEKHNHSFCTLMQQSPTPLPKLKPARTGLYKAARTDVDTALRAVLKTPGSQTWKATPSMWAYLIWARKFKKANNSVNHDIRLLQACGNTDVARCWKQVWYSVMFMEYLTDQGQEPRE